MATKPDENGIGKQQEVIDGLQKAGTLKRSTVLHVLPSVISSSNNSTKDTSDSVMSCLFLFRAIIDVFLLNV